MLHTLDASDWIERETEVAASKLVTGLLEQVSAGKNALRHRCNAHDTEHSLLAMGGSAAEEVGGLGIVDNLGDCKSVSFLDQRYLSFRKVRTDEVLVLNASGKGTLRIGGAIAGEQSASLGDSVVVGT